MQKRKKELDTYYKNMIAHTAMLFSLTTAVYLTPSASIVNAIHWGDPEFARLMNQRISDPENEAYNQEFQEYRQRQDSLRQFTPAE
ncbi:MAG: hypothetical protein ACFB10_17605 [Salibacteraceae bacterium]